MKHIVDNVNKLELTFKTIDLEGRVPSTDAIEFLSVEEPYREGRRYSPFVRVRYALNGVKQDKAFPLDVDKGIFLSIDDNVLEEKLRKIAPKIVEILQKHEQIRKHYFNFRDSNGYEFKVHEDAIYLYGVNVYFTPPATMNGLFTISLESEIQKDKNKCLYSQDVKGEKMLMPKFDNLIELRDYEKLILECCNTEDIAISGELLYLN